MPEIIKEISDNQSVNILFYKKVSVCAWCKRIISVSGIAANRSLVSHGICNKCKIEFIDNNIIEKIN